MHLASLISGGKDSLYAAYLAKKDGHEIDFFLCMDSENKESYMFHTHNLHLLKAISEISDIPLIIEKTKGIKEDELEDLKKLISKVSEKVDGITTGAIASNYQKQRVDKICSELGLKSIAPFWGRNPEQTLRSMIKEGFEVVIVAVAAPPLDEAWLGRKIDEKCVDALVELNKKHGIHIMGEGGEYDTFVLECPLYNGKKILLEESDKHWDVKTKSGALHIKKIRVVYKIKTLKFDERFVDLIASGMKNTTWRINDEKNISPGDVISLCHKNGKEFAKAEVFEIKEKTFGTITEQDYGGYNPFSSKEEMYTIFSAHYNMSVTPNTSMKIIKFRIINETTSE